MIPEHIIWHQFPRLETQRLVLRQIVPADISKVFEGLSNKKVIKYYGVSFKTLEATEEQMDWYEALWNDRTGMWWGISLKGEKDLIGACGYNNYEEQHQKAELGYWLIPGFWGKGYATEALRPVLEFGFDQMQLQRIEAFVEKGNRASNRLLEKLDFKYEGTMENCEFKNGRFISLRIYALFHDSTIPRFHINT